MKKLNDVLTKMDSSSVMVIHAKAQELKNQGKDIINLTIGEIKKKTSPAVIQATIKALIEDKTKYAPLLGISELRKALSTKYSCEPKNVIITVGAKQSLYNIFQVLLEPGQQDEVIVFSPYWVSYPPMVELAGGVVRLVHTNSSSGHQINLESVKQAITPKTKAILVNSPNNPTGAIQEQEILDGLLDLAEEKGIYLITDEIYKDLVFEKDHTFLSFGSPNLIIIDGVSKSFSMTGFRIGWVVANEEIIETMGKLQSHSTASPTTFAQYGATEAVTNQQGYANTLRNILMINRDIVKVEFLTMPHAHLPTIDGAFYAFPDFSVLATKTFNGRQIKNSVELAELILNEANVATVPGSDFGKDWHLRISFATDPADLTKALSRIRDLMKRFE